MIDHAMHPFGRPKQQRKMVERMEARLVAATYWLGVSV